MAHVFSRARSQMETSGGKISRGPLQSYMSGTTHMLSDMNSNAPLVEAAQRGE